MTGGLALIPSAYVLLRRHGTHGREVLLQYRQGTGFLDGHWACAAAGHVEPGETVFAAAVREADEELGVTICESALVPLTVVQRRHEDSQPINQRVDFFFACDRWSGEPSVREPEKSAALMWARLDQLPTPVVPHELAVLHGLRMGELAHVRAHGFRDASGPA
ncbi:MAG: NUDIX domain-containing protein [Austwickia sp.]|nr:NUDIX domain-containing protein [Austwickia sp.]MBK8437333.1 NUDIX domain-containing protein [Austwickia sp.]MBK9102574.1 NUDIX domain-containing protein [Austwickia sp.]